MADAVMIGMPLAQAIGRWGNFINIEAYGYETDSLFRMGIWENGIYKEVHPCFLYESIITFALFLLLWFLQNKRNFKGQITYLYFIIYSFARFFIEGLRYDSLNIGNYRISQILSAIIFAVFCFFLSKNIKIQNSTKV